jgi:penicillin-binding protein 2
MWKVVNAEGGTAKAAKIPKVEVAGKTGTAQFWDVINGEKKKDNHTWFMSFAPYQNPRFACVVMIQGGKSGGSCPAPVVQRVLRQCLDLEQGLQIPIQIVKEEAGFKKSLEAVHFPDDGPQLVAANTNDDPDEGAGGDGEQRMAREEKQVRVQNADQIVERKRRSPRPTVSSSRHSTKPVRPRTSAVKPPRATPVAPERPAERPGLFKRIFR